ncbi:hypothetical protein [Mumia zhuanghuii]|uniref:Uncharacterized protein n=1 Tax=Mumia zhuanghuii TaxID=2585211 RepID=A0A5C4MPK4_9ACTN|nr:hypothetical protein [Mumia zhuanghuii]TNC46830.1 hypothetical protein FHE65_11670 [Mumia zhuanghuii]TNC47122.1 hypothetical protein FHE65_10915 [Mumia zhuanghuii]
MTFWDLSATVEFDYLDRVLAPLSDQAHQRQIPLMVVGAAARDLLINGVAGAGPLRATDDVDVAVAVRSWEDLDALIAPFEGQPPVPHRFSIGGMSVDIVPFGAVESPDRAIVWPNASRMTVLGFSEALSHADVVRLRSGREVTVPSLAAQAVLKLIAWNDRHDIDSRDAEDLRTIFWAGSQGPFLEELYGAQTALLQSYDWDPAVAGAAALGHQAHAILDPYGRRVVASIIAASVEGDGLLLGHMRGDVAEAGALARAFGSPFADA